MQTTMNPSAVTRILKHAGYPVSKRYKGSIRGLTEHTAGYRSTQQDEATVRLTYYPSSLMRNQQNFTVQREQLERVEQLLQNKGYHTSLVYEADRAPYVEVSR